MQSLMDVLMYLSLTNSGYVSLCFCRLTSSKPLAAAVAISIDKCCAYSSDIYLKSVATIVPVEMTAIKVSVNEQRRSVEKAWASPRSTNKY